MVKEYVLSEILVNFWLYNHNHYVLSLPTFHHFFSEKGYIAFQLGPTLCIEGMTDASSWQTHNFRASAQ